MDLSRTNGNWLEEILMNQWIISYAIKFDQVFSCYMRSNVITLHLFRNPVVVLTLRFLKAKTKIKLFDYM